MHIFESKKSGSCSRCIFLFVVVLPFNYKNPLFQPKKVACECFEIAILVSKLRQIRPFPLLLWRFYGAFMLEWLATVLIIMRKCPAILSDAPETVLLRTTLPPDNHNLPT